MTKRSNNILSIWIRHLRAPGRSRQNFWMHIGCAASSGVAPWELWSCYAAQALRPWDYYYRYDFEAGEPTIGGYLDYIGGEDIFAADYADD